METATINSTATTSTTTSSSKAPSGTLDKNAFLSLLVAQLKNQDPTASQDPNAMVQQMTSFSSLEQQQNMNASLTSMQAQNSAIFQAQSASLIGKQVQVTSSSFNLTNGASTLGVNLSSNAADVSLSILDSTGKLVAVIDKGALSAGNTSVNWNGKDANGNQLSDGTYSVSVNATDSNGAKVTATTTSSMRVDSVSFTNGTISITAGGQTFPLSSVNNISA